MLQQGRVGFAVAAVGFLAASTAVATGKAPGFGLQLTASNGADGSASEDFEAADLAREQGIPMAEAEERLAWQQDLPDLVDDAESRLGGDFGGVWVDPADGDRIKLAVAGDATSATRVEATQAASEQGVGSAVDVVTVQHSEAELLDARDRLAAKVAEVVEANDSMELAVAVGLRPDRNAVVLHLPPGADTSPSAEVAALVDDVRASFGDLVQIDYDATVARPLACSYNTYCDPPLRGGIRIWSSRAGCTGAFVARSRLDGKLYQFTAGHCVTGDSSTWTTHFANGSRHAIGRAHSHRLDSSGDMAILRINNPSGWRLPRGVVLVTAGPETGSGNHGYKIHRDAKSVVGQRVCTSGSSSVRTDCGTVTELDMSVTYPGGIIVSGLVGSTMCAIPGDSGAPVYASNTAYGIVAATGPGGRCNVLHQDIQVAENAMNVNVVHEA